MSPSCCVSGFEKSRLKAGPMSWIISRLRSSMMRQTLESMFDTVPRMPPIRKAKMAKYQPQHQVQHAHLCVTLLYFGYRAPVSLLVSSLSPMVSRQKNQVRSNIMETTSKSANTMRTATIHSTVCGPSPARWPRIWRNWSVSVKKPKVSRKSVFTSVSGAAAPRSVDCRLADIAGLSWLSISFRALAREAPTPLSNVLTISASTGDSTSQN
mmetsp:Transcript_63566/g.177910  ORF Transcript_63566/g.177910 Transcript_63566/m.177910 type:complete len:211 (-) Transcript_63566:204-836(-)